MGMYDPIGTTENLPAYTLDSPMLKLVEEYWRSLRHAHRLPARIEVNPAKIDCALPHAFMLQRVAAGTARFRVAGQALRDVIKMDPRGMPFSTLFAPSAQAQVRELIETALSGPAIIGLPLISENAAQTATWHGALLLLPLRDSRDQTTRLMGAFVSDAPAHGRACRFTINPGQPIRQQELGLKLTQSQRVQPIMFHEQKRPDTFQRPALKLVINNG